MPPMNDHCDQESGRSRNTATAKPEQSMTSIKASMAVKFVMSQCSVEIVSEQSADRRSVRRVSTVVCRAEQCSLGKPQLKQFFRRPAPRRSGFQAGVRMVWLVWCLTNSYTFVALKLAWGEARRRECILSDTRPTEQRSPRPI